MSLEDAGKTAQGLQSLTSSGTSLYAALNPPKPQQRLGSIVGGGSLNAGTNISPPIGGSGSRPMGAIQVQPQQGQQVGMAKLNPGLADSHFLTMLKLLGVPNA